MGRGLGSAVDGGGWVRVCPQEVLDSAGFERALLPVGEGGQRLGVGDDLRPLECVLAPVSDERESAGVQDVSHPLRVEAVEDRDHESVAQWVGAGWVEVFASGAPSDVLDDRVCAQATT